MCYNDSYHSALGCTPAEVFLGRRMNISPLPTQGSVGEYTTMGYALRVQHILSKTHALVFEKIQEKRLINQLQVSGRDPTKFQVDDKVLLFRPQALSGDSRKLSVHWYGPYTIDRVGILSMMWFNLNPTLS
jgi:hypothetical protein